MVRLAVEDDGSYASLCGKTALFGESSRNGA